MFCKSKINAIAAESFFLNANWNKYNNMALSNTLENISKMDIGW